MAALRRKGIPFPALLSDFDIDSPLLPRLAGLASWESLRRAGRHCGLLLRPSVALRVYGSSKNRYDVIFGPSSKSSPWPREPGPTRFWSPRQTGQKRRKPKMSNEIAVQKETGNGKPMVSWAALLNEAVTKPGFIHEAYSRFHNYSLGNQLLALFQCLARGIQPGPLATFPRWKELGRFVKKGEKALTLCMPLTCKRTKTVKAEDGTEQ